MAGFPTTVIQAEPSQAGARMKHLTSVPIVSDFGQGANPLEFVTDKGRAASERNRAERSNRVQVAVRARPQGRADGDGQAGQAVFAEGDNCLALTKTGDVADAKKYYYDFVFTGEEGQEVVYDCIGRNMLADCFAGYNVTLFAYGQTGSGKTHSIMGQLGTAMEGIVPRFCKDMLTVAQDKLEQDASLSMKIAMSMVELYNEKVRDLLEKKKKPTDELTTLHLHETKDRVVYVGGLSLHTVMSWERINSLLEYGLSQRQVHETNMNETSSRSHSIVSFYICQTHSPPSPDRPDIESSVNIVDLAGSERQSKTGATGDRLQEAKKINLSLLMLGRALNSFSEAKGGVVPLRESKLTRLLSESFGGNARTYMLACVSPSLFNLVETASTLDYAQNAKNITNNAKVNMLKHRMELQQLQEVHKQVLALLEQERARNQQLQMELTEQVGSVAQLQEEVNALRQRLQEKPVGVTIMKHAAQSALFVGRAKLSLRSVVQGLSQYTSLPLISPTPQCDAALLIVNCFPVVAEGAEPAACQLGQRLDIVVHVIAAKNLPAHFAEKVYCKFVFKSAERDVYQSPVSAGVNAEFDFKKRFAWKSVSEEMLAYLSTPDVLTFEVIGEGHVPVAGTAARAATFAPSVAHPPAAVGPASPPSAAAAYLASPHHLPTHVGPPQAPSTLSPENLVAGGFVAPAHQSLVADSAIQRGPSHMRLPEPR